MPEVQRALGDPFITAWRDYKSVALEVARIIGGARERDLAALALLNAAICACLNRLGKDATETVLRSVLDGFDGTADEHVAKARRRIQ